MTKARDDLDLSIADLIRPDVDKIIRALKDLALGVRISKDGVVYTERPDFKAASYLLDRVAGKPRQAITVEPDQSSTESVPAEVAQAAIAAGLAASDAQGAITDDVDD